MFGGSLVLGITLGSFAAWLHWRETHGWPDESFITELDHQYRAKRARARGRIHIIIAVCGVLILIAAFAGPDHPVWVAAWMCVMAGLVSVMCLAALDAFRTHRYQTSKLPEIRRQILGDDD